MTLTTNALDLLMEIAGETPLLAGVVQHASVVDWQRVDAVFPQLSGGEQAVVKWAASMTGRGKIGDGHTWGIWEMLTAVDRRWQVRMIAALSELVAA